VQVGSIFISFTVNPPLDSIHLFYIEPDIIIARFNPQLPHYRCVILSSEKSTCTESVSMFMVLHVKCHAFICILFIDFFIR